MEEYGITAAVLDNYWESENQVQRICLTSNEIFFFINEAFNLGRYN